MARKHDDFYEANIPDETTAQEVIQNHDNFSKKFVNLITFWESLNKFWLFAGLLVFTITCAICFNNLFFKILLVIEVLSATGYMLYTSYTSSTPNFVFNKLEDGYELIPAEEDGIKFSDLTVKGPVNDLKDLYEYVKTPDKFKMHGYIPERKVMFIGETGSGKNALIKAFSNETGLPIIRVHASRFFIDDDLFDSLFKIAPYAEGYILQIDSYEMLNSSEIPNSSLIGDSIIDTLLRHLSVYENVILFATSEEAINLENDDYIILKCFKKIINMPLPSLKERIELIKKFIDNFPVDATVNFKAIAQAYFIYSIGEIKYLVAIAKSLAHKENRAKLTQEDFFNAMDSKRSGGIYASKHSEESRKAVAYHEAGHALVSYLLSDKNDVLRIISSSRGDAAGYTMYGINEDKAVLTKEDLINRVCVYYGGRCSEKIVFNQISTGASQDIQVATSTILAMVRSYGMSDAIGAINVAPKLALMSVLPESSDIQNLISKECMRISHECEEKTLELLTTHKKELDVLANYLIEHESITGSDMIELLKNVN